MNEFFIFIKNAPITCFCATFGPKLACNDVTNSVMTKQKYRNDTTVEIGRNQTVENAIIHLGEGGKLSRSR